MNESHPTYLRLKEFLEKDPLCRAAVKPLSNKAVIRIRFTDHDRDYFFTAINGVPLLEPRAGVKPDLTLVVPPRAVGEILAVPDPSLPAYGIRILELAAQVDPAFKIRGWTERDLFTIWRHGYFGYLTMGGSQLWGFLKSKGYGSIAVIYRKLARSKPDKS